MKYLLLAFSLLFVEAIHAASFDCKNAATDIEKSICGNSELSELDRSLSEMYFSLKKGLQKNQNELLINEQRTWLSSRQKVCAEKEKMTSCLVKFYQERIEVLSNRPDPCPEKTGLSQQGNCLSAISLEKAKMDLENKYKQLIAIFNTHIKEGDENFPFERLKEAIVASQKSWLQYVNDQCLYSTVIEATSSGATGAEYSCKENYAKQRTEFLDSEIKEWINGSLK